MATDNNDNKSFVARLGNDFLALISAATSGEFGEKFKAAWTGLIARVDALESKPTVAAFDPSALLARLDAIEAKAPPTEAQVKQWAESAASFKAVEATAAVGTQIAAIVPAAPTTQTASTGNAAGLIAEGKFEEAWAISPELKAEFPDAKCYAAFARNMAAGRIKIHSR
jgi:hypothetical protein